MNRNDTYDPMGNLATVTLNGNAVSSYTYDDTGNRTRVDFGNGTWQTFSYGNDARYLPTGIDYAYKCDSNDTVTNKGGIRLTRSNGGNPLSWADNTDKFIKTFSYDTQGRLANADIPGVSRTDYGYDWVGNRTSPTAVYNDADQLTSYNGNTYTYYGEGGMINGAGRTFGYIPTGDPYQVSLNGVSKNGAFDPHGLRHVSYGAATIKYCYDITASTPAMITEGPNDGTTTYYYVREPDGELIMRKSGTDYKYYHFDELGSTLFLTDANGIQTDKYVYNAWGKVVSSSGSTVNPYRYIGKYGYYYDTETNLYLLGKRYYDADAGVFCQRDAAKDGLSFYAYTSGSQMVATDPWGEACKSVHIPLPSSRKLINRTYYYGYFSKISANVLAPLPGVIGGGNMFDVISQIECSIVATKWAKSTWANEHTTLEITICSCDKGLPYVKSVSTSKKVTRSTEWEKYTKTFTWYTWSFSVDPNHGEEYLRWRCSLYTPISDIRKWITP